MRASAGCIFNIHALRFWCFPPTWSEVSMPTVPSITPTSHREPRLACPSCESVNRHICKSYQYATCYSKFEKVIPLHVLLVLLLFK